MVSSHLGALAIPSLIARVEAPAKVDKEHERNGAGLDLVAGDAAVTLLVRGAGLDDGDLERGRGRFGKSFVDIGGVGGRGFVNAHNLEDGAGGGFEFQLESELLFYGGEDGDAIGTLLFKLVATGPLESEVPGSRKVGFVDNRLIEISSGEDVESVGKSGHGEILQLTAI